MATPYIMPLGFIYRPTEDGAIITLTDPRDSLGLKLATPVTIWRYSQGQLATAKIRGQVTAVGYMTATFKTVESRIDPRWPTSRQLLRPKTPVYLNSEQLHCSFQRTRNKTAPRSPTGRGCRLVVWSKARCCPVLGICPANVQQNSLNSSDTPLIDTAPSMATTVIDIVEPMKGFDPRSPLRPDHGLIGL